MVVISLAQRVWFKPAHTILRITDRARRRGKLNDDLRHQLKTMFWIGVGGTVVRVASGIVVATHMAYSRQRRRGR